MHSRPLHAMPIVALLALSACAGPAPRGDDDVVFMRTSSGIALFRPRSQPQAVSFAGAVPSMDGSAVVQAVPSEEGTSIVAIDPRSGAPLWSHEVAGGLEVKVASPDARFVALGEPGGLDGYPPPRAETELHLIGEGISSPKTLTLDGNYVPEAFSTDGGSLFVIQYLPPLDPDRYRVRRLEIATGEVEGVYTVDAELQRSMGGTARVQAASADGRRLYTLYTLDEGGHHRAFIHVLSLDELWAHCVDLPADFGLPGERATALSVSPDGARLFVANTEAGRILQIDTNALRVTRSTEMALGAGRGATHAAAGPDGTLYVGRDRELISVDAVTMTARRTVETAAGITGIQVGADGRNVYVGLPSAIATIDAATGRALATATLSRIGAIDQIGRALNPLPVGRKELGCAC